MDNIFRYIGYVSISIFLGWFSNLSGNEEDFILKMSNGLIPILITILAFYVTIIGFILKELADYKEKTNKDLSNVLKSMRRDTIIEISIICIAFISFVIRGALSSIIDEQCLKYLTIASNAVTVFSFVYFLLLIYDSVMGLWALINENNNES